MYQLNVHLQYGDLDVNGHPHQCWDRKREGKSKPFEVEHFDGPHAIDAMLIRIKHYQERGITVISATHDMKMLNVSDRILWIRDGKVQRLEERKDLKIEIGGIE